MKYGLAVKPTDYWETPYEDFARMNSLLNFTLDAAATATNRKVAKFFSEEDDGLEQSWKGETVWCNPPYSKGHLKAWTEKALREAIYNKVASCLLIPHDTSTQWWRDNVIGSGSGAAVPSPFGLDRGAYAYATSWGHVVVIPLTTRVRFLKDGKKQGTPTFASVYVIYWPY